MILISSNETKIKEFKKYLGDLLTIESGKDLKEVKGTMDEVITYKSIEAGKNYIVEDTILIINGEEVVDIRWKLDTLKEGDEAIWITSLGYNIDDKIKVYRGIQKGIITLEKNLTGFAFDPYFIPVELSESSNLTLTEIGEDKQFYSARIKALKNLMNEKVEFEVNINDIEKWNGNYQN
jgi:inosine/xanthosine triphosphate pyrophosphatase family protein